jgi:hypothetical protein
MLHFGSMNLASKSSGAATTHLLGSLVHKMNTDPEQTNCSESNPPTLPTRRNRQREPHKSASPHRIPLPRSDPARQEPKQWRIPHASKKKNLRGSKRQRDSPRSTRLAEASRGPVLLERWWRRRRTGRARTEQLTAKGLTSSSSKPLRPLPAMVAQARPASFSDGGGGGGRGGDQPVLCCPSLSLYLRCFPFYWYGERETRWLRAR